MDCSHGQRLRDHTPEQLAAAAERARLLKSPRREAEQERLRLLREKLGMASMAETLRRFGAKLPKVETNPAEPQQPTPKQPKRGRGGGRKHTIEPEQITEGIRILQSQDRMSTDAARATLREAGINGEDGPLYRLIIKPA
jgi:hypothetical protein